MRVMAKMPGKAPECVEIDNTLEALQKFVGGYIEAIPVSQKVMVICNEEGRLEGLEYNCSVGGYDFVGPVLFVGERDEDFADVPYTEEEFKGRYAGLY